MSKTNNEMIGELTRKVATLKSLIEAHNEPIKEQIKEAEAQIKRLLLEDGKQQVDDRLLV